MRKVLFYVIGFFAFTLSISCNDKSPKEEQKSSQLDYSNSSVLDSLMNVQPIPEDTLFLGFRIGITKESFSKHVQELKKQNRKIEFHNSANLTTAIGRIKLGDGYVFTTSISTEESGKTITGVGQYFLSPEYSKNGNLIGLKIYPTEDWDGISSANNQTWLRENIRQNSTYVSDRKLLDILQLKEIISSADFVRQKGNLLIYSEDFAISYRPMQTIFLKIKQKDTKDSLIQQSNKGIKF